MGTRIIGRVAELEQLASALAESDLVTLVGAGGVGKTTLARALATETRGSVFVDLSECRSAPDVTTALGRALRLRHLRGDASDDERIARSLRRRGSVLVVLDNFEQVVEHAEVTIEGWRKTGGDARFLVTSRERLRLPGERLVDILPLDLEDAVALFRLRAGAASADRDVVVALVSRADRLPLAIELVAAHSDILGAQALASREGPIELTSRTRGTPPRQASMGGAFEWSFGLLSEDERTALVTCSVFRGGFDAATGAHVIASVCDGDALDLLRSLRDKSLLQIHPGPLGPRLSMLSTIRARAEEKLDRMGLRERVRAAHASHYLETFALPIGAPMQERARRASADRANLLAALEGLPEDRIEDALELTLALDEATWDRGPMEPHRARLEHLLARADTAALPASLVARAMATVARLVRVGGRPAEARDGYRAAVAFAERGDDPWLVGALHVRRAGCLHAGGFEGAREAYEHGIQLLAALGDMGLRAIAEGDLGMLERANGEAARGRVRVENALSRSLPDTDARCVLLQALAHLEVDDDAFDSARDLLRTSEAIATALDQTHLRSRAQADAGAVALLLDDATDAPADLERAALGFAEIGFAQAEARARALLGIALQADGRLDEAARAYADARDALLGRPTWRAGLPIALLAGLDAERGRRDIADERLARARALMADGGAEAAAALRIARAQCALTDLQRGGEDAAASLSSLRSALGREAPPNLFTKVMRHAFSRRLKNHVVLGAPEGSWVRMDPEGAWVVVGDGPQARIPSKPAQRLLSRLLAHRLTSPRFVEASSLIRDVWPGPAPIEASGKNRLHVALTSVRRAMPDGSLQREGSGYRLDPALTIVVEGNV